MVRIHHEAQGDHINKLKTKTTPYFGWRLRLMFGMVDVLTSAGLIPPISKVTRWPMKKRQSMKLAQWLTHPPLPASVAITEQQITSVSGEPIAVRIFTPIVGNPSRPPVLYLHGGGWIAGGMGSSDYICANVAADVGVRVLSVEYRLAPEFPFPAGLEDCYEALCWLAGNHSASGHVAVMGDSAGGNLAAALCLLSKQRGRPRIAHQTLIYPVLDATLQSDSMRELNGGLSREQLADMVVHYLQEKESPTNPLVSPLFAPDLSGLPPAFIVTANADPLRDEGKLYAKKMSEAGVSVRYLNVPEVPHGFLALPKLCKHAAGTLAEINLELRALRIPAK